MKTIHIVQKTHLDIGYTDFSDKVIDMYLNKFVPQAVEMAMKMNQSGEKKMTWTVGSWLIKRALEQAQGTYKENLEKAIKNGDIVYHCFPFTTHTELLDEDLFDYGLSIATELDERFQKHTIAGKMTDVPCHTIGMLPCLVKRGIKLIHIGVNAGSKKPNVPECFLWGDDDGNQVIVIYNEEYGGYYENKEIDDVLYVLHTLDNHGLFTQDQLQKEYEKIKKKYQCCELVASDLNTYAEKIWEIKDTLPVFKGELGDTWIHGVGSDPYKTAAMRELLRCKNRWLAENKIKKTDGAYKTFCENLALIAEHTWGLNTCVYLKEYIYDKKPFQKGLEQGMIRPNPFMRLLGKSSSARGYCLMEQAWALERSYLDYAIAELPKELQEESHTAIHRLRPARPLESTGYVPAEVNKKYSFEDTVISFDDTGAICYLDYNGVNLIDKKHVGGAVEYVSYTPEEYKFFNDNYNKPLPWVPNDFCKLKLKKAKSHPQGRFAYHLYALTLNQDKKTFLAELDIQASVSDLDGAPRRVQILYEIRKNGIHQSVFWFDKDATRLPEAIFFRMFFKTACSDIRVKKISETINVMNIVENGNRKLMAVEQVDFDIETVNVTIKNFHSPLFSPGAGEILKYDNRFEDVAKDGFSFNLLNNIWETNFKLWYNENALFEYEICFDRL